MEGSRIKNFPISFFAVIMGLTGLAIAYIRASFISDSFTLIRISLAYVSIIIILLKFSNTLMKSKRNFIIL